MKGIKLPVLRICMLLSLIFSPAAAFAQVCDDSIEANTPGGEFIIHPHGLVTHERTGLIWMRCTVGQVWNGKSCSGDAEAFSWGSALQAAAKKEFAGYSDWRLPNKNELETIFEGKCHSPAVNQEVFPKTPNGYFWSSSPYAGSGNGAWSFDFSYGSVNASAKNGKLHVRLVRGGE